MICTSTSTPCASSVRTKNAATPTACFSFQGTLHIKCFPLVARIKLRTMSDHSPPKKGSTKVLEFLTSLTHDNPTTNDVCATTRRPPRCVEHRSNLLFARTLCVTAFSPSFPSLSHSFSLSRINLPPSFTSTWIMVIFALHTVS